MAHSSNSHTDTLVHLQAGLVIMWQALKLSNAWDTIDDYYRRIGGLEMALQRERDTVAELQAQLHG